ncbi:MAG: hypothetical protein AMS21_12955 [Gemmatimonas sp. SG8_38_2]|nr:MAG: hypothetical protein AMS21_12955 [Gemmatimonas sp. SG8_38_2]
MRRPVLLSLALLVSTAFPMWAQPTNADTPEDEVRKPAWLCFRGGPKPRCSSFLITEIGYAVRQNDPAVSGYDHYNSGYYYDNEYLSWEVGWMKNFGNRLALGATLFGGFAEGDDRLGLKPRIRLWLASMLSLDVGGGILFENEVMDPGFTGHVGLNLADVLQPYVQVEVLNYKSGINDTVTYLGIKGGSYLAALGVVAIFVGLVIYGASGG